MQNPVLQDEINIRQHKRRFIYISNWTVLKCHDLEESIYEDELLDEQRVCLDFYRKAYARLQENERTVQELLNWYVQQKKTLTVDEIRTQFPDEHFLLRALLTPSDLSEMRQSNRQYKSDLTLGIKWYFYKDLEIRYRLGFGWEIKNRWYPDLLSAIESS